MPQVNVQKVSKIEDRSLPVFAELDQLSDRIRLQAYNLFTRRGAADGHALDDWVAAEHEVCWPSAELIERDAEYVLKVALAGFAPAEINVTATPREIIIKAAQGRKTEGADDGKTKCRWSEFRSNDVFRRIELPARVDVERVTASLKNGLLEIVAPQAEPGPESAKKIEVSEGS